MSLSMRTNLFVTADRGMNEAIIVRWFVGLVMSFNPTFRRSSLGFPWGSVVREPVAASTCVAAILR